MIFVSDVHAAFVALKRLLELGEPVAILGDLANLNDYRTGEGAIGDVLGIDFARESAGARARGDYPTMRSMWMDRVGDDSERVRADIGSAIDDQYQEARSVLSNGSGFVMHGNVDRPASLRASLPEGFKYVHGDVIEVEGRTVGFAGGGVATPLGAQGEVSDEEMELLLAGIASVDVLCTHVPPAVGSLRRDVITGRDERGSEPIRRYLEEYQPRLHLFGDVHQPQATTWRVGATRCFNAGYFRATGRYLRLRGWTVQVGRLASLPVAN